MGEAFGGKQTQESTTRLSPELRGQSTYALGEARRLYNDPAALPSSYVPISPDRMSALDAIRGVASNGQVAGTALSEWQRVMGGQYLHPGSNPYLDEIVNRSVSKAAAAPVSGYATGGRFGSGAMANAMADTAQLTAARIYDTNYARERENMMRAMGAAGGMQELQYADPLMLGRVGMEFERDQAAQQAEAMRQYMHPFAKLEQFQSYLGTNPLVGESNQFVTSKQPFQWGQALLGGIGGLMNPLKGMFGGGE